MELKRAKVIMLPTKNEAIIVKHHYILSTLNKYKTLDKVAYPKNSQLQHLYFTSNEEIKEGDWCIHLATKEVITYPKGGFPEGHAKKIIATTDKSLGYGGEFEGWYPLPQPSQSFIEKYCKVGGIDEVMVEYEWLLGNEEDENRNLIPELYLKIDSHKTITIHPIKDSWTKEEVIAFGEKCFNKGVSEGYLNYPMLHTKRLPKEWINKNL